MERIALISDTHLTSATPAFDDNLVAAQSWVSEQSVAATIHLGDITADAASEPAQLDYARAVLAAWPGRLLTLPGNHDVGDNPSEGANAVLSPQRLERYRQAFGPDFWSLAVAGWTLIGLNAQRLGRGDVFEQEQDDWLRAAVATAGGPIGLLLHKPLFRDGLEDTTRHHRYVPLEARAKLLGRFVASDLRFVASGHTHQRRRQHVDGVEHVWVPSAAFTLPDAVQETIGEKRVGMMQLTLDGDTHRFEPVWPLAMRNHDLSSFPDTYPAKAQALRDIAADRHG